MSVVGRCLQRVIDEAADGRPSMCITLESKQNAEQWVQLTWDVVNAAWPHAEEPLAKLRELGITCPGPTQVTGWEAGKYATFTHEPGAVVETAAFISAYLRVVLGIADGETELSVTEEEL